MTAYEMAATVDFGLDAKQGLLDLRSEAARLALAARLFRAALKRLDFVERAQARRARTAACASPPDARNGYPVRRGPVARTLVGSGGGCRRDRARRRAGERRPDRVERARAAPDLSLAAPGGRALPRLVAALGARLADADRRRAGHAQAQRLPRAPARRGLRLPPAPAHDLPAPRPRATRAPCCCTSWGISYDLRVMNNGDRGALPPRHARAQARMVVRPDPARRAVRRGLLVLRPLPPHRLDRALLDLRLPALAAPAREGLRARPRGRRDRTPAVPPARAPAVTRPDPAPPAQPPPSTVPGSGGRPQPRPTPAPTPRPTPTPRRSDARRCRRSRRSCRSPADAQRSSLQTRSATSVVNAASRLNEPGSPRERSENAIVPASRRAR